MTYEEALAIVEELRGRGNAPFSIEDKRRVSEVYPQIMGRRFRKTSCRRCYHDAVIEMAVQLRKTKKLEKTMANCDYHLRAGFIIRSPKVDEGRIYTNANLTNEVAKRYLELFPGKRNMFDVIPEEPAETPTESVEAKAEESVKPSEKKPAKARSKRSKKK